MNGARRAARATFAEAIVPGGHVVDPMIWLLLIVGFLLGPLKLLGASWFAYALPDSIAALVLLLVAFERLAARKPERTRHGVGVEAQEPADRRGRPERTKDAWPVPTAGTECRKIGPDPDPRDGG